MTCSRVFVINYILQTVYPAIKLYILTINYVKETLTRGRFPESISAADVGVWSPLPDCHQITLDTRGVCWYPCLLLCTYESPGCPTHTKEQISSLGGLSRKIEVKNEFLERQKEKAFDSRELPTP